MQSPLCDDVPENPARLHAVDNLTIRPITEIAGNSRAEPHECIQVGHRKRAVHEIGHVPKYTLYIIETQQLLVTATGIAFPIMVVSAGFSRGKACPRGVEGWQGGVGQTLPSERRGRYVVDIGCLIVASQGWGNARKNVRPGHDVTPYITTQRRA